MKLAKDLTVADNLKTWLKKPGNNFCALPFMHMAVETNGSIRPCCMGDPFDLNISNKTIQEVYNDPVRFEFMESFKRNEKHPACYQCWEDPEIRAKFSTSAWSRGTTEEFMQTGKYPDMKLKWLEIKPGNRCNLKCRICGVHGSSSWTKDTAELDQPGVKFKDSNAFKYTQSCNWIDDPKIWNDINEMESIEFLHFMGGEPFMVPEHFQLIQALVDHPNIDTSKITIGYNTNGTYFPTEENFDLYNNFKKVNFALSIDDIDERFNYQRKLANWEEVRNNLVKFQKLNNVEKYFSTLDPAISVFNIFYLEEIYKEFSNLEFADFIEGNTNIPPNHYVNVGQHAIHIMPQHIKNIISTKYRDTKSKWIANAVEYMYSRRPDPKEWNNFTQQNFELDSIRKEKFHQTFKEFYEQF